MLSSAIDHRDNMLCVWNAPGCLCAVRILIFLNVPSVSLRKRLPCWILSLALCKGSPIASNNVLGCNWPQRQHALCLERAWVRVRGQNIDFFECPTRFVKEAPAMLNFEFGIVQGLTNCIQQCCRVQLTTDTTHIVFGTPLSVCARSKYWFFWKSHPFC